MKRSSLITAALCLAAAGWAQAHSMHQSTAEAEYNPKTQKLEVSLTVFIDDLELALMRHSERPMSIAKTPAAEFDTQIQSYLTKTFVLTEVTGKAAGIEWVGEQPRTEVHAGCGKQGNRSVRVIARTQDQAEIASFRAV
jgi:hypothetical protein